MDQEQLQKVYVMQTELEYLFGDNQWLPAIISQYQPSDITIELLRHPREHSGVIHPSANDIKTRLRLKS